MLGGLDFGYSLVEEAGVLHLICARFSKTLELAVASILIALTVSLPLGTLAGLKQNSWLDSASVYLSVLGLSIPNFWLGAAFNHPFFGLSTLAAQFRDRRMAASDHAGPHPGDFPYRLHARLLRLSVIQSLELEHVLALRARGTDSPRVLGKHIFKNTLIPVVTIVGLEFGLILEGAVITEVVFFLARAWQPHGGRHQQPGLSPDPGRGAVHRRHFCVDQLRGGSDLQHPGSKDTHAMSLSSQIPTPGHLLAAAARNPVGSVASGILILLVIVVVAGPAPGAP